MLNSDEKVALLHAKMKARRQARERRGTAVLGTVCAVLAVCLFTLVVKAGTSYNGGTAELYSGAAMLFENAGGYVLIAVVSFAAAVVITVLCIRATNRKKSEANGVDDSNADNGANVSSANGSNSGDTANGASANSDAASGIDNN